MREVKSPPNHVDPKEYIGRQLFSKSHFRNQGWKRVLPGAFLHQGRPSLFADRPDYGEPAFLAPVSKQNAESRGANRSLYGWEKLTAKAASRDGRKVVADPIPGIRFMLSFTCQAKR